MNVDAKSADSAHVEEFRNAHKIWREADDSFHDRFRDIVTRGRSHDLDALAQDLANKFEHFIKCSKQFVTMK